MHLHCHILVTSLVIMSAIRKSHLGLHQSATALAEPKPRIKVRSKALKTIQENEFLHSSVDLSQSKIRRKSSEIRATSPYAAKPVPLLRSTSVIRLASRLEHPRLLRDNPSRPDISFSKTTLHPKLSQTFIKDDPRSPSPHIPSLSSHLQSIETALKSSIQREDHKQPKDWKTELFIYNKALKEVGALEVNLDRVLSIIRCKYEGFIVNLVDKFNTENAKNQKQISDFQSEILKLATEKRGLKRKFEKIAEENVELSQTCESYQQQCLDLQEKMRRIATVKITNFPPTETAWRVILTELETYKDWKETVDRKLKVAELKEKKLLSLLNAIKRKGFPVEDVYRKEVCRTVLRNDAAHVETESDSEVGGVSPPRMRPKPPQVPSLLLDSLEPDLSSDSSSEPEVDIDLDTLNSRDKQTQDSSQHSSDGHKDLPLLKLPQSLPGFHQEFMSKYEEFSESWRKAIDAEKRF